MRILRWFLLALLANVSHLFAQDKAYQEWYLQREDLDIFVKELGTGKDTVIVVHGGFGANHDYMLDAIKGLEKSYHFVLFDQRGSLLSPAKAKDLSFPKDLADLEALVHALRLHKVNLLCHSMGTLLGMEYARRHPEKVSHLILTGCVLPASDSVGTVFSERYYKQVDWLSTRPEVKALLKPYEERGVGNLRSASDIDRLGFTHQELTDYWRINFAASSIYDIQNYKLLKGGRAYYKMEAAVIGESVNWIYDYRPALKLVKTTIINGDHDFMDFDGKALGESLKAYPSVELRILPKAGHVAWIDQPALFKTSLQNALKK